MTDPVRPATDEACRFLSDYAARLLGCGATCIRIEKNVTRMAEAFGMNVELSIMPSFIQLSLRDPVTGTSHYEIRRKHKCAVSYNINTQLSKLSWEVADRKTDFAQARRVFEAVLRTTPTGRRTVLLLVSAANAAFCRLFGGDAVSMLLVFLATVAGVCIRQALTERNTDIRVVFLCAAFFSSVIASGGYLFGWGHTPDIALGTSVLYLIPGIPYINSVSDLLEGHYICAFSRFVDAAVLTACLSAGLAAGLLGMGLSIF